LCADRLKPDQGRGFIALAEGLIRKLAAYQHSPVAYVAWTVAALCAAAASLLAAPGMSGVLGAALAMIMMAIAAVDARHFIIPNELVLAGILTGLVAAAMEMPGEIATGVGAATLRGLLVGTLLLGFRAIYRRVRGRQGLGLGDVKLAAVAGVWLSWTAIALAIDFAALTALAAVLAAAFWGRKLSANTRIPFGLFFAPAIWVGWLLDKSLIQ
jgi:leader peptidase (prepilin peptidase)/N-methyltransferase